MDELRRKKLQELARTGIQIETKVEEEIKEPEISLEEFINEETQEAADAAFSVLEEPVLTKNILEQDSISKVDKKEIEIDELEGVEPKTKKNNFKTISILIASLVAISLIAWMAFNQEPTKETAPIPTPVAPEKPKAAPTPVVAPTVVVEPEQPKEIAPEPVSEVLATVQTKPVQKVEEKKAPKRSATPKPVEVKEQDWRDKANEDLDNWGKNL